MQANSEISVLHLTNDRPILQRFTVAFNFLCVLLGLLYEGRHLSLSVLRKIPIIFYSTFTNVVYFCHVFLRFNAFYIFENVFFHPWIVPRQLEPRRNGHFPSTFLLRTAQTCLEFSGTQGRTENALLAEGYSTYRGWVLEGTRPLPGKKEFFAWNWVRPSVVCRLSVCMSVCLSVCLSVVCL